MVPRTQYARSGDVSIAYQVVGDGPAAVMLVPGWMWQVEHMWEEPSVARFFERFSSFARMVIFDRRGSGLSDRVADPPTLEQEVADLSAVLDAAAMTRATLLGHALGGPLAVTYAHHCPERVTGLVLYASVMRNAAAPGYEWAFTPEQRDASIQAFVAGWGEGTAIDRVAPSRAEDPTFRAWLARLERLSASPGTMLALSQAASKLDVRDLLPALRVPSLVIHRTDDSLIDVRHSRYAADKIPGARYVELAGADHMISVGDSGAIVDEVEEFLTGGRSATRAPRALLTVMFTDIVDSTSQAALAGDARWRDVLASHTTIVRRELGRFGGQEIKNVGDGFLVTFGGPPSDAVRCALAVSQEVSASGIAVRIGLHTGECELLGTDVAGMAVHIAARVGALAGPGEVLVSGTVRGTVIGSEIAFEYRGSQSLRGVQGEWPLFAVRP